MCGSALRGAIWIAFRADSIDLRKQRFEPVRLREQRQRDGMLRLPLQHDVELPDGLVDIADIQQHAAIVGVGLQVVGVDLDALSCNTARPFPLRTARCTSAPGRTPPGCTWGRLGKRLLEGFGGLLIVLLEALLIELQCLLSSKSSAALGRRRGIRILMLTAESCPGINRLLARAIGLVTHLHALDGVLRREAGRARGTACPFRQHVRSTCRPRTLPRSSMFDSKTRPPNFGAGGAPGSAFAGT